MQAIAADKPTRSDSTPHLSHSRINRYLHCPESYRLHYVEGLRPRHPPANLVFGQAVHTALARLFHDGQDAIETFTEAWEQTRDLTLTYSGRSTWDSLRVSGLALLERFVSGSLSRITGVIAVERRFELVMTGLELPFIGFLDLFACLDGRKTLIDFKTAASRYGAHEVALSDQLTAYQMAEPDAEQTALCVLVKTKTPRVEWHVSQRNGEQLEAYVAKIRLVSEAIRGRQFYRRPGPWCSWCDFQPVCTGEREKAAETLVQIEPAEGSA